MPLGMKNVVLGGILLIALAFAFIYYDATLTYKKSVKDTTPRSFFVTGEGKVAAIPNVLQFQFSVITEGDKNIGNLVKDNTTKVEKAMQYLKDNGIADKDIKTEQYSVEPRYHYANCTEKSPCSPPEIVGYTIRQSVGVKARDLLKVGSLLSGVVTSGANLVAQFNLVVDSTESYQQEARNEAIAKAKQKAEGMAKAAGFTQGRLLSIDEQVNSPYPVPYYGYGMGGAVEGKDAAIAPAAPIQPGSQDVVVTVTLRYEIE